MHGAPEIFPPDANEKAIPMPRTMPKARLINRSGRLSDDEDAG
jgi:hypothetical protein